MMGKIYTQTKIWFLMIKWDVLFHAMVISRIETMVITKNNKLISTNYTLTNSESI